MRELKTNTYDVVIVKLGGRSITLKEEFETLLEENLIKATEAIVKNSHRHNKVNNDSIRTPRRRKKRKLFIIHGAGSFGHHQAHRCGLAKLERKRFSDEAEFLRGVKETRKSVRKLNEIVYEKFVEAAGMNDDDDEDDYGEVRKIHVSEDGWMFDEFNEIVINNNNNRKGESAVSSSDGLREYFDSVSNFSVPILHGDVLDDAVYGKSIVSGDRIANEIAKAYAFDENVLNIRVIFVTGASGIYNRDPDADDENNNNEVDCKLFRKIETNGDGSWRVVVDCLKKDMMNNDIKALLDVSLGTNGNSSITTTTCANDCTGGIKGKLESCVKISSISRVRPIEVYITSVDSSVDDFLACLNGLVDVKTLLCCRDDDDDDEPRPFCGTLIINNIHRNTDASKCS